MWTGFDLVHMSRLIESYPHTANLLAVDKHYKLNRSAALYADVYGQIGGGDVVGKFCCYYAIRHTAGKLKQGRAVSGEDGRVEGDCAGGYGGFVVCGRCGGFRGTFRRDGYVVRQDKHLAGAYRRV